MKRLICVGMLILGMLTFAGCAGETAEGNGETGVITTEDGNSGNSEIESVDAELLFGGEVAGPEADGNHQAGSGEEDEQTTSEPDTETTVSTENSEEDSEAEPESEETTEPTTAGNSETGQADANGRLVVIDAGHQSRGNSEKEPIGPGATEQKAKVTGGATGCVTGQTEYELNLRVSFFLRDELQRRGYEVILVRESNDVDISNSARAAIANEAGADVFIRIHANGSDNASVSGTETLCQTPGNPYNASLYPQSRRLSEKVLDGVVNQTGFKKRSVHETDTMSGINWCQVPVTIVEMGFLSNPTEDELMSTDEYRKKIALGIADGIDEYFSDDV